MIFRVGPVKKNTLYVAVAGYNAIIDNALISISAPPSVTPCHGHTQYRMPYSQYKVTISGRRIPYHADILNMWVPPESLLTL